ncbi:psbP domain-containing protein 6, chloroplastic [Dunaliella salina]|uniref:PsbP domain-containing protein 6, chloroplastic n=1 Tax=Dunaliella salina TaxID=3046 RepID=A0ABQ7FYY1_DUNSA|nr:psbP domain-containing protein 6, chloroplastic [Dunaliella salina]|eukprot:KAF5827546.1 psbP domain-containing protein 6, chloroplastic [Dunaliella salina]
MLLNKSLSHTPLRSSVRTSAAQPVSCHSLPSRRSVGLQLGLLGLAGLGLTPSRPASAEEALVPYVPTKDKTPALRSGVIKQDGRYSFEIPATAKEQRITNLMSGNFCLPNCAEPWLEADFVEPNVGQIQLLAIPILKLTNIKDPKIRDVGSPENLLQRVGSYMTGAYFDEDSVVAVNTKTKADGIEYYEYELNQIDAQTGPHTIAQVTSKGEVLYMLLGIANEKQWNKGQDTMHKVMDSFKA